MRSIYFITFLFVLISSIFFAQDMSESNGRSYVFNLLPSSKKNSYGLSIGLIGSEVICNVKGVKNSNGLNFQLIGQGLFIPLNFSVYKYENSFFSDSSWMVSNFDVKNYKARHNGLLLSLFGTMTDEINGVSISCLSSMGQRINGVSINFFMNLYTIQNGVSVSFYNASNTLNGLQIGIINKTTKIKGLQIGIWNVNEKRKFPIFNW